MAERIIIYGNSGSGKSTMAIRLARELEVSHLDLDTIAWGKQAERKPLAESIALLNAFVEKNESWIIEGCYGDLIEAALAGCTQLRFLNPGIDVCVRNCRSRPWESHKYVSREEQDRMLDFLLAWVRAYETRDDEFCLKRHRRIFEAFSGDKREYGDLPSMIR